MQHRGDDGETDFPREGGRVSKASDGIEVLGELDELSAVLGCIRASLGGRHVDLDAALDVIQHHLVDMGCLVSGIGAVESARQILDVACNDLERWETTWHQEAGPLCGFVIPRKTQAESFAHLARTVCRRAERGLVRYCETKKTASREEFSSALRYLNRLSACCFELARVLAARED